MMGNSMSEEAFESTHDMPFSYSCVQLPACFVSYFWNMLTGQPIVNKPMKNFIRGLPFTRIRMFLARLLYLCVKPFLRKSDYIVNRGGIYYQLDPSEMIDLSIFILGSFQKHITRSRYFSLPDKAIILDIGANMGALTLPFARKWPQSTVYAMEPADTAYSKLLRNLKLNPGLSCRIKPCRILAAESSQTISERHSVYASWKVTGDKQGECHPVHGGVRLSVSPVEQITIDDFCKKNSVSTVDLIKIDTDGDELKILKGACHVLDCFRPVIIFEVGDYLMQENKTTFHDYYAFLDAFGYSLINSRNGRLITPNNFHRHIPLRATIDIIALPPASATADS